MYRSATLIVVLLFLTSKRAASSAERISAVQAASREFLRNNVSRSLMTRIQLKSLTAINVGNGEAATTVGSFFIRTPAERHDLFLILQIASRPSIQYSRYGQTIDLEDFKDHKSISFVDHLDLNGDGTDEIVLEVGATNPRSMRSMPADATTGNLLPPAVRRDVEFADYSSSRSAIKEGFLEEPLVVNVAQQ